MRTLSLPRPPALLLLALGALPLHALAAQQHESHADSARVERSWSVGAQAIWVATQARPAYQGRRFTEAYVTQPLLHAHAVVPGTPLTLRGALNFEGLTLARGELNAGIYGEGYVDRRHPHTFVHELMAVARQPALGAHWSLAAGKGFVPFGTDDPMSRPFVKYPVNHHLAQILERWVAVAAVRREPLLLEAALFNGDEPASPWQWPRLRRFGDSWAARATLLPARGVELAGSVADVASPEHVDGAGLDQRKWSVAARWQHDGARPLYLLAEWARTDERSNGARAFRFESLLAEAASRAGPVELALRLERTDRPEEERLADPFRTPRPHGDFNLIGITRWQVATAHAAVPIATSLRALAATPVQLRPFVEVAWLQATPRVGTALFVPAEFYGSERQWSLSLGIRVGVGRHHGRMGRYGAADPDAAHASARHSSSAAASTSHPHPTPPE